MAPIQYSCLKKVLLLYLFLVFITSALISAAQPKNNNECFGSRRKLLVLEDEDEPIIIKKKTNSITTKNQTKFIKPTSNSSKNQTKLIKTTAGVGVGAGVGAGAGAGAGVGAGALIKNKTKLIKTSSEFDKDSAPIVKSQLKKLNSSSKSSSNSSARSSSLLTMKSSDLPKLSSSKNKTTKPNSSKEAKTELGKDFNESKSKSPDKAQPKKPSRIDREDEDDLVSEFRDLPSKFQETIVPDLEKISKSSKIYFTKYNKEFTKGFKPYVGNKYASTTASVTSFAFIVIPLILVSLIFTKIKAYFSLQKLLIFIQIYLSIYFTILCLSSLVTGLEPLRFFYSSSQSTYVCVQVLQTLGYVLYLLLLLMYLILVFSTETGLATKLLGLGQTFVGFAVGLHYYMTVFHRAVLHQPPKTSWKVHALYATCFLVICLLERVDRRKKAYLVEGGEEGKKS